MDLIQPAFSSGELTPSLHGRVDLERYHTGLKTCKNFIVMGEGGVTNRPGLDFIGATKDHTKRSRLIPFEFSTTQAYALEFGDLYMRVLKDGGHVLEPSVAISGATQANPVVVTTGAAHGYANGDEVYIDSVVGMTELNQKRYIVANKTANTFELQGVDGLGYTAYVSGGTVARIFTLVTPYLEADIPTLNYAQSADVMTLTHPSYQPQDLTRTDHHVWSLTAITFAPETATPTGAAASGSGSTSFKITAIAEETLEESLPTAPLDGGALPVTITCTDPGGIERWNIYMLDNGIYGYIGTTEDPVTGFVAAVGIQADVSLNPPKARNPFSGANDYPSAVAYYEQRKCFGGTNNDPQKGWMTQLGKYKNMTKSIPQKSDDAIDFTVNSLQVNRIRHFVPMEELLAFTSGSEWKIGSGDVAFTPTTMRVRKQGKVGCSVVPPLVIGDTVIFVQEKGKTVRDFAYTQGSNTYNGMDLTLASTHLFRGYEIDEWDFAQIPFEVVWAVRDDGVLLGMTYIKQQGVIAWHRHDTDGEFESVCSIPGAQEDDVYVIVKRTIGGSTKRYVERFHARELASIDDAFFVDSGLSYSNPVDITGATQANPVVVTAAGHTYSNGDIIRITHVEGMTELNEEYFKVANKTASTFELQNEDGVNVDGTGYAAYISGGEARDTVTSVSGLDHLEGETVSILGDGSVHEQKTVVSGAVTLNRALSEIHIGLPYVSDFETLDLATSQSGGYGQSKEKKVSRVAFKFEKSRGGFVGNADGVLTEFKQRTDEDYGKPIRWITGIQSIVIDPSWNSNGRVLLRQTDPLPITILSVIPTVEIGG